jgi:phage terminase Nu1 subunit (DNA packaging protein)
MITEKMITAGEFSKLIEVSRQQMSNYRKQGMPSTKKGKYYYFSFDAIQWLVTNGLREITLPTESKEELTIHERNKLADTKLKEHKLQVQQGKYVLKDKIEKDLIDTIISMRNQLLNIPNRMVIDTDIKEELTKELKIYINDFSDSLGKL